MSALHRRSRPPYLVLFEGPDRLELRGQLRLETVWINEGGPGSGIRILVWGPALSERYLSVTQASVGPTSAQRQIDLVRGPFFVEDEGVGADVADWKVGGTAEPIRSGAVSDQQLNAIGASMVAVGIHGTVLRSGRSTLLVSVCPLETEEGDLLSVEVSIPSVP